MLLDSTFLMLRATAEKFALAEMKKRQDVRLEIHSTSMHLNAQGNLFVACCPLKLHRKVLALRIIGLWIRS
jgi:hypothetical protein